MLHDVKRNGGDHVCCSYVRPLFSMKTYFSLSKHIRNCRNGGRTDVYVKPTFTNDRVEQRQDAQDVTSAEKQQFSS